MTTSLDIIRGVNGKPAATDALVQNLERIQKISGELFTGFPLIATPDGKYSIDATLVSPLQGVVLFDLVEGTDASGYEARQDDLATKVEARLKLYRELVARRKLLVPLTVVSFAPGIKNVEQYEIEDYPLVNEAGLVDFLNTLVWEGSEDELYRTTLSAIENLSSIRKSRSKREIHQPNSRGAHLKRLENAIATLDHRQNKAVIETVDGVQRIRGLAGSGKTIVLALKAAYLHTQYPEWRIAVTFQTRSLKGQFRRLINNFCIEQGGEEPDWTKLRILNAWGAPGGDERDGIYHEYCRATGTEFLDFRNASNTFGEGSAAFDGACNVALRNFSEAARLYDVILVDEAQDFTPSFLKLCYSMLTPPKRLIYAYDELQNLSGTSLPPPEELFGENEQGQPLVSFDDDRRQDVILQKCYRNSRPVLVTAHSLGFGIYRKAPEDEQTGLVQMFDYPALWEEIGYKVRDGQLAKGQHVVLERTDETSPSFLEQDFDVTDLVQFEKFTDETQQNEWLVEQIQRNLNEDELRHDDIIIIHPDPLSARRRTGPIRKRLFDAGVQTHLAGVDTNTDVFFRTDTSSVTFTGIYRAKGNEAGMVYVINAQDCNQPGTNLASLRNRLFTAITRSKAWVRVIGWGPRMQDLIDEFSELARRDYSLDFTYPDDAVLRKLRIVHRDLSAREQQRLERHRRGIVDVIHALESGELRPEDIDKSTRNRLKEILARGE